MITSANAIELNQKAHAKRLENKAKNQLKLSVIEQSSWEEQERIRMREDLAQLHKDFATAKDGKEKMYIASAMTKLAQAAGLPNAGNYRPTSPKAQSKIATAPLD